MQWFIIGISGVTCGGKTTLAHSLREYLQSQRNQNLWKTAYKVGVVHMISQDDYFLPVEDKRHEWLREINAINFEVLSSMDMKQMLADINATIGHAVCVNKESMNSCICSHKMQQQQQQQMQSMHYVNKQVHNNINNNHVQQQQHNMHNKNKHRHTTNKNQQQQQQQLVQNNSNRNYKNFYSNISTITPAGATTTTTTTSGQSTIILSQKQKQHQQQQQQQQQLNHIDNNTVNILIIEGFMIFNVPEILYLCHLKFHFHLPYEKCYERRINRTYDPPDIIGYFELCVWPYYEKNLAEYRERKDIIYLNGEIERERIFKYVLKRITNYVTDHNFNYKSEIIKTQATTTTITKTTPANVIGLNLRMQHHQQQLLQQQQQQEEQLQQHQLVCNLIQQQQ